MVKLIVKLGGDVVHETTLTPGQEYLAGRASDCAIPLLNQKAISRHHLKLYTQEGQWIVELLSRFGTIQLGTKTGEAFILDRDCYFSVGPFEFNFRLNEAEDKIANPRPEPQADHFERTSARSSDKSQNVSNLPSVARSALVQSPAQDAAPTDSAGNFDATVAGVGQLVPFLRIRKKDQEEILKLEGQLWVAGRDPSCEILIDDHRSSRRHFEMVRTQEGFFVTDLGSANGTLLNEEPLPANEPFQLTSGDVLRVSSITLTFEVRDLKFHDRIPTQLPVEYENLPVPQSGLIPLPTPQQLPLAFPGAILAPAEESSGTWRDPKSWNLAKLKRMKLNPVRLVLLALIPLILFGLLRGKSSPPPHSADGKPGETQLSTSAPTFEQLGPEKQRAVRDAFNLAKTMYMQGKYELCLSELQKLHEIVPTYENSHEYADYCQHGADLALRQRDLERRDQEKSENNRFIGQVVDDCRRKMTADTTLIQVRECLAPAMERDPENPKVLELQQIIQVQESERARAKQSREAAQQRKVSTQRILERAMQLRKSGEFSRSLNEYRKYLEGSSGLSANERAEAERSIASIRKELSSKVEKLLQGCKESLEKSQFKAAIKFCDNAVAEDPSSADAQRMKAQAKSEMRKELKSMYEDSVLEESMGNIDTAKEKWKQIIEKSIPGEEYHNKARKNLDKYSGGD